MTNKSINTPSLLQKLEPLTKFEQQVAERMSLDIRYFCPDVNGKASVPSSKHCRQPVTTLPSELADMITATNVGGIVLFAENVQKTAQVVRLTHAIQQASLKSAQGKPLIISIDQEGGRVARFAQMTGFAGNMAIGASYTKRGTYFSEQVNRVIAKELNVLGINNNYAPVIDVNTNVENPVINTRSFGESPEQVAELGISAVNAIQAEGIMATLKHFPGHGDTHVDSHLGLPRVDHDKATIDGIDLMPFAQAIKHANPAMIMTAHIQYPVLDDSVFVSKKGEELIRPATMSRKILTDLLRGKMTFNGIIATDALDMAGVTHFFTEVEAVVETFVAGADLAVMPFKVRTPDDIINFHGFIKKVAASLQQRIKQGDYALPEFEQAITRLNHYKNQYINLSEKSLSEQINTAEKLVANQKHLLVEQALADAAITVLKGHNLLPLQLNNIKNVHLVVANKQELAALQYAIENAIKNETDKVFLTNLSKHDRPQVIITYFVADDKLFVGQSNEKNNKQTNKNIREADVLLATVDIKTASLVDLGGMDDLTPSYGSLAQQKQKQTYATLLKQQLIVAKQVKTPSILIAKGSPFLIEPYSELANTVLLNFDDRIYQDKQGQMISPGFNASLAVIVNQQQALGVLPVSLTE